MRPVTYAWKQTGQRDVGFIAEEAAGVRPELVLRDAQGQVQSFDYQHYTAVLTRAVQEQQTEIEALRGQLRSTHGQQTHVAEALAARDRELSEQRQKLDTQSTELAALRAQLAELVVNVAGLRSARF